jgi:hypothetical protein
MKVVAAVGGIGLIVGIVGGFFGSNEWLGVGSFVFAVCGTIISIYYFTRRGTSLEDFIVDAVETQASPIDQRLSEQELRRKDRGTVPGPK